MFDGNFTSKVQRFHAFINPLATRRSTCVDLSIAVKNGCSEAGIAWSVFVQTLRVHRPCDACETASRDNGQGGDLHLRELNTRRIGLNWFIGSTIWGL